MASEGRHVFISGMFRSGTTLVCRMLGAHGAFASLVDSTRLLFNSFRYDLGNRIHRKSSERFAPLEDYFLAEPGELRTILDADLNTALGVPARELLVPISQRASAFSPLWAERLPETLDCDTYKDLLDALLNLALDVYGNGRGNRAVFKEVWCTEMIPAFLRAYPRGKAVIVVRDPRAVAASRNAKKEKYPLFFLGRQWRKLAFVGWAVQSMFPDRVMTIRYEDIVAHPEQQAQALCRFLEVDWSPSVVDTASFLDGSNQPWRQNTSYGNGSQAITAKYAQRWRESLSHEHQRVLELICFDMMHQYGYEPAHDIDHVLACDTCMEAWFDDWDLANWIQPFSFDMDQNRLEYEMLIEKARLALVMRSDCLTTSERFRLQSLGRSDGLDT